MAVEVVEVSSQEEKQAFNAFPRAIYRGFFGAPSFPVLERASSQYDPLFGRVEAQPLLAIRNGCAVGRITASVHHAFSGGETGFGGYFESLNDPSIAAALVKAAACWLAARGVNKMIGPVDLSPHERLGLLVEGFRGYHHPGMPYNPPYYANLLAQCGVEAEINLFAYHYDLRRPVPARLARVAARTGRMQGLQVRRINFNDLAGEGEIFSQIHNGSMNEIWGFVPLSPDEGSAILRRLRGFYDPDLILLAEIDGKPAGLCLAMAFIKRTAFSARLNARLAVLAVLPQYRFKGLEAALILECIRRARRKGISGIELSLVAENNAMMNKIIQSLEGVEKNKIYRIYKL